jgi:hypothetical protein
VTSVKQNVLHPGHVQAVRWPSADASLWERYARASECYGAAQLLHVQRQCAIRHLDGLEIDCVSGRLKEIKGGRDSPFYSVIDLL